MATVREVTYDLLRDLGMTTIFGGAQVFQYYPYVPGPVVEEGTRLVQVTEAFEEANRVRPHLTPPRQTSIRY